jgi:hypothetical protein
MLMAHCRTNASRPVEMGSLSSNRIGYVCFGRSEMITHELIRESKIARGQQ